MGLTDRFSKENIITHDRPDGADYVFHVNLQASNLPGKAEQLWGRKTERTGFVTLRSIPFFAYDLAPADVVELTSDGVVSKVAERSDRHVVRIGMRRDADSHHDRLHHELMSLQLPHEWRGTKWVAVELKSRAVPPTLVAVIAELQQNADAIWEFSTDARG